MSSALVLPGRNLFVPACSRVYSAAATGLGLIGVALGTIIEYLGDDEAWTANVKWAR